MFDFGIMSLIVCHSSLRVLLDLHLALRLPRRNSEAPGFHRRDRSLSRGVTASLRLLGFKSNC
jgi:hypothetical protein